MKFSQIEAFIAVAESGSIGAAATRLGLTQPAVTRQIQQLEKDLGTPLLDRRTKPPSLTPSGRTALSHCRRLIKARDELANSVSNNEDPTGNFRLGVAFGAADLVLGRPIDTIRKSFPQLKVEMFTDWSSSLMKQTQAGMIDGAIVLSAKDRTPLADLDYHLIDTKELLVVAPKNLKLPKKVPLKSLGEFDWVMNPKGCWYRDVLQNSFEQRHIPMKIAIETFGLEFQLSLVARGVGLGFVPKWAVDHSEHRRDVQTLNLAEYTFEINVWSIRANYLGQLGGVMDTLEGSIGQCLK